MLAVVGKDFWDTVIVGFKGVRDQEKSRGFLLLFLFFMVKGMLGVATHLKAMTLGGAKMDHICSRGLLRLFPLYDCE